MVELDFLKEILPRAYERFCQDEILVSEKAKFDVVTNVDKDIERFFAEELKKSGYDGTVSVECGFGDFKTDAIKALAYL